MPFNNAGRKVDLPFWITVTVIIVSAVVLGALFG
jgi:hypothetical protein